MIKGNESVRFVELAGSPGVAAVIAREVDNEFGRHTHDSWVVGIVDSGTRSMTLGRERVVVPKGGLYVIPPGIPHACGPEPGCRQSYRALCLERGRMRRTVEEITGTEGEPVFTGHVLEDQALTRLLEELFRVLDSGLPVEIDSVLLDFLSTLLVKHGSVAIREVAGDGTDGVPDAVKRARKHLLDNLTDNVRLEELARVAGLSPFYLQREFVRSYGVSPLEFLLRHRVKLAVELLSKGMPLADVALETGFYDQSHFNRQFKRIVGVSPGRFTG